MRLVAAEGAVDIAATAHEVDGLADVTHRHEHLAVVLGVGIAVNHIVAVELLRHRVGHMRPRVHDHSVGEQTMPCVLVADTRRHVLRRGVIELLRSGFQCAVVGHYQSGVYEVEVHRRASETAAQSALEAVVGLPVEAERWGEIHLVTVG